jgi:hypothetical protein
VSTPVATIVNDALRETNIVPIAAVGTTKATTNEQTEALGRLNAFVKSVYGYEMGEELSDWLVPAPQRTAAVAANFPQLPYPQDQDNIFPSAVDPDIDVWQYPPKNSRIVFGGTTTTAWFPERPDDGSRMALMQGSGAGDGGAPGAVLTLDGNGRTINGANTATFTDPVTPTAWLYRADLGDWQPVVDLTLVSNMAFPPETDDYFTLALAIRLAPRFGKQVSAETTAAFKRAESRFRAKYRQAGTTTFGATDIPRSLQSYISGRIYW